MYPNYPKTILNLPPQFGNADQIRQLKLIGEFERKIKFPGFVKLCIEEGICSRFVYKIYDEKIERFSWLADTVYGFSDEICWALQEMFTYEERCDILSRISEIRYNFD